MESMVCLTLPEKRPELFPCSPGFAARFDLSEALLGFLRAHRASLDDGGEPFQELLAGFSPTGSVLALLERGEEDKALALLPSTARDELTDYCRQRVYWAIAIKKLRHGEKQARKRLLAALPLIKTHPAHANDLVHLVYEDLEPHVYAELAEVMEILTAQVSSPGFREATAYAMGVKAMQLLPRNFQTIKALLDRAYTIHPGSEMVKTAYEKYHKFFAFDQLGKAFRKQNVERALQVAQGTTAPEIRKLFFSTMKSWSQQIAEMELTRRVAELRRFYNSCLQLDPHHPVTHAIGAELQRLEMT